MEIPKAVSAITASMLNYVHKNPQHTLKPYHRLLIYDAFGPTFAPSDYIARIGYIMAGNHTLTLADQARAKLAILTAKHLLPLWEQVWQACEAEEKELLDKDELNSDNVPTKDLPEYTLSLAEGLLNDTITIEKAFHEANEIHYIVGNLWDMGDYYPAISGAVTGAALEALQQSYGLGPFNRLPIEENPTDLEMNVSGTAALPALFAYAGIFEETTLESLDPQKCLEFWNWWLAEAIPQAWELVDKYSPIIKIPEQQIPFSTTVATTMEKAGFITDPKTGRNRTVYRTK